MFESTIEREFTTGIDEAGRGPLAGPVVAAAVSWPSDIKAPGFIKDSKKLNSKQRENAFLYIVQHALDFSYYTVGPKHIDRINILQATYRAMEKSFFLLRYQSRSIYVDGNQVPPALVSYKAQSVVKGDSLIDSISCASIIAKVIRDKMMIYYDSLYPDYQFIKHKGYGTKLHYEMIKTLGPCEIHRKSFKLIKA